MTLHSYNYSINNKSNPRILEPICHRAHTPTTHTRRHTQLEYLCQQRVCIHRKPGGAYFHYVHVRLCTHTHANTYTGTHFLSHIVCTHGTFEASPDSLPTSLTLSLSSFNPPKLHPHTTDIERASVAHNHHPPPTPSLSLSHSHATRHS